MIQTTVGALLDDKLEDADWRGYGLYVVRDGDIVFYIGQTSRHVITRLWEHLGLGFTGGRLWCEYSMSTLGRLIKINMPESRKWQIEFPSLLDCQPLIADMDKDWFMECCTKFRRNMLDTCEQALINHHKPCFNTIYNPHPRSLPERYKHPFKIHSLNLEIIYSALDSLDSALYSPEDK